jgi:probable rRNA maturation factor
MNFIDFQIISKSKKIPGQGDFQNWVDAVLTDQAIDSEVVIRVIDEQEMMQFNQQYRDKQGSTNILSFSFEAPEGVDNILLGDLLVCVPVVEREALQQNKPLNDHWAHMIIHGLLHLIGYDHIVDKDAEEMEALEIKILKSISIKNPYQEDINA